MDVQNNLSLKPVVLLSMPSVDKDFVLHNLLDTLGELARGNYNEAKQEMSKYPSGVNIPEELKIAYKKALCNRYVNHRIYLCAYKNCPFRNTSGEDMPERAQCHFHGNCFEAVKNEYMSTLQTLLNQGININDVNFVNYY